MKIDKEMKVVILVPTHRVGEHVIDMLKRWDLIREKPEIITEAYKVRAMRNRIVISYPESFGSFAKWNVWQAMKATLENLKLRYAMLTEHMTEKKFMKHFNEIYGL